MPSSKSLKAGDHFLDYERLFSAEVKTVERAGSRRDLAMLYFSERFVSMSSPNLNRLVVRLL